MANASLNALAAQNARLAAGKKAQKKVGGLSRGFGWFWFLCFLAFAEV